MLTTTTFFPRLGLSRHSLYLASFCWLLSSLLLQSPSLAQRPLTTHGPSTAKPTGTTINHRFQVCTNGTVMGIGNNYSGELTNSAPVGSAATSFVPLSMPATMVRVVAAGTAGFGIDTNGNLWSWGDNSDGMLGLGSSVSATATPTQVPGISQVVAVSGGWRFVVALCSDGTVWSWGWGGDGSLGTGSASNSVVYTPQQISPASFNNKAIRSIVCGDQYVLALDSERHIWSWGIDGFGELGIFATRPSGFPIQPVPAQLNLNDVRQIEAGNVRSAAVLTNGDVYTWGNNGAGQLGQGTTSYVGTPTRVPGISNVASIALNVNVTIAVLPSGATYVWGYNDMGGFGLTSPSSATTPIPGPFFSEGVQITGQYYLFTSIERTGTVKVWGNGYLGYSPSAPTPPYGGSYTPTTPTGVCLSAPTSDFPGCGPLRAFYQNPSATYVAAYHGYTVSPAEIGQPGVLTTIDVSQQPYYGQLTFNGIYHVLGDVKFINGTVDVTPLSQFWVDGAGGTYSDFRAVSIQVENAQLQLRTATLRSHCDSELWGGILLLDNGTLTTSGQRFFGSFTTNTTIRDTHWGVWAVAPTSHYSLSLTTFLNNYGSVTDGGRTNIQAGEGITNCTFRSDVNAGGPLLNVYGSVYNSTGITFSDPFYNGTYSFGDYGQASFSGNVFDKLRVGISGTAGNATVKNSTFTNCWYAAAVSTSYPNMNGYPSCQPMVFSNCTVNLPANFPAGYTTTPNTIAYGIVARLDHYVNNSTIRLAPTTAGVPSRRIGVSFTYGGTVEQTKFTGLDVGIEAVSGEWFTDYLHNNSSTNSNNLTYTFTRNTFTYPSATAAEGISFLAPGYTYGRFAPIIMTCNSFDGSAGTASGTTGVWVKSGTVFPTQLVSPTGGPNGNNFSALADVTKRFVYEGRSSSFSYLRYNSAQEYFGGTAGNDLYNYAGTPSATASNPGIAGTNACGSAPPGVYARSVAGTEVTLPASPDATTTDMQLGAAYPNPAHETVTFTYALNAEVAATLVICDLMGRQVAEQPLSSVKGEVTLSVRELPAGLYIATLKANGQSQQSHKLTITH